MREVFERLKALAALDAEIARLDAELERGPKAVGEHTAAVAGFAAQVKALEDRAKLLKAQIKLRENDLKSHEQKIARLKEQSSQVKNNKEFMAFRAEIANAQAEADRQQAEALKILDVVQQAEKKVAEIRVQQAGAQALLDAGKARMDRELSSVTAERAARVGARPAALAGIPPEILESYDRARRSRGNALCGVDGEYCAGCQERQTRNDLYAVENVTRVVVCKSCNRILTSV
jgi:hypothetical protein